MKIKVLYQSRSGNTKKVAEAIAQSLSQVAEAVPPAYPPENVKLLFLGGGVYAGKVDKKIVDFINTLNTDRVKNVALFGTSGNQDLAIAQMRELLKSKGINVLDESFLCKGKTFFFANRQHPSKEDLKEAQDFARRITEQVKE